MFFQNPESVCSSLSEGGPSVAGAFMDFVTGVWGGFGEVWVSAVFGVFEASC